MKYIFAFLFTIGMFSQQPPRLLLVSQEQFSNEVSSVSTNSTVSVSTDDYEEDMDGTIANSVISTDLELGYGGSVGEYIRVGMRFTGLNIPQGATITSAYIQFSAERTSTSASPTLELVGEDSDNAATFSPSGTSLLLNRTKTTATVSWTGLPTWTLSDRGVAQQTPDISTIIQEIVNRAGYTSSSAIVIFNNGLAESGTNSRRAKSWDNNPSEAPQLFVEYDTN